MHDRPASHGVGDASRPPASATSWLIMIVLFLGRRSRDPLTQYERPHDEAAHPRGMYLMVPRASASERPVKDGALGYACTMVIVPAM